ncbi:PDR/VanB family oxidoreductase [Streptomyces caniscabiei]|uniref:Oxidoreductase n=1 Tax=Streptomyces caniscabiei TaxID=2746961 RepID=A0A927L2H6_9ACTN|nr:PDR/VanB family oxidoreductase [Streptomyces caniscabiei]MBD9724267.1 oxidoreductase [Streptomyces caniscabiei]MDX3513255.1 PDR/VanB family oxidoreductase [Streptomyces caniscabiei]MDX3718756.1 PDR/VanB family oxidoreductase [Streptomyces caniscabiei]WEO21855.1 PDR/VanB family oxidoreductase [Streptomyces caniscabiei]
MNDQLPPTETVLTVASRTPVADGVVSLTLRRPDGGTLPSWTPGAHIDVLLDGADGDLIRQYSLCGRPEEREVWQIAVLREPRGRGGSAHVHDHLREGSTVRVRGPRNNFPLRPAARQLFVAGGVGITPVLSMVEAADAAGADWRLLYGGRTRTSMAFLDRLAPYGDRVLIRPEDEYGLLDLAAFLGPSEPGTLVHACGPEPLLRALRERCEGWPPGTLGVERFAPVETAGAGPAEAFEVELARSGLTLTVPPDRSVLEAVEKAGVEVASSCREGTCGTCETDVLDGDPDHRDSLLTEDERAAGDTMLICVSRSCGPRLVLDL